ncbi:hypothetical protein DENSPDRAFT_99341 [Dentipellis sp. KUC8613]|nr:hypothetical protein DENSPDRAFT_99341 [Dentipellis sp. KUC8613]
MHSTTHSHLCHMHSRSLALAVVVVLPVTQLLLSCASVSPSRPVTNSLCSRATLYHFPAYIKMFVQYDVHPRVPTAAPLASALPPLYGTRPPCALREIHLVTRPVPTYNPAVDPASPCTWHLRTELRPSSSSGSTSTAYPGAA